MATCLCGGCHQIESCPFTTASELIHFQHGELAEQVRQAKQAERERRKRAQPPSITGQSVFGVKYGDVSGSVCRHGVERNPEAPKAPVAQPPLRHLTGAYQVFEVKYAYSTERQDGIFLRVTHHHASTRVVAKRPEIAVEGVRNSLTIAMRCGQIIAFDIEPNPNSHGGADYLARS